MSLPAIKIVSLLVKTTSKPIANTVKAQAKTHQWFRKVCIHTGQTMNVISNHINIRMLGHRIKRIKPLDEEAAVQKGADLMGEVIVYSISVGTILFEFNRRNADAKKKEALKAVRRKKKAEDYETRMAFINDEIGTMKAQVDEIREEVLKMKLRRKSTVSWLFSSEPGVENTTTASSRTLSFSKLLPSIKSLQPPRPNLEKQP